MNEYLMDNGQKASLEDLCEKKDRTLLYFYPKDMTSGCTKQARWFQENIQHFSNLGIQIIGVSRDSVARHKKFIDANDLSFALIADVDSNLSQKFDVIKEKSMYGRMYMGIERSTFLLDSDTNILEQWRNVTLSKHFDELLALY